ncbi:hypothetical protein BH23ACT6_BH23ACT6_25240 [soil metagenome]
MTTSIDEFGALDDQDGRILAEIREVASRVDPVPALLPDRVKYAMTVRLLEAEVAELTAMPMAAVRSESGERVDSISFSGSNVSLMVTIASDADGVRVDCWVTSGGALVEVRFSGRDEEVGSDTPADGKREEVCDEHGRCAFTGLPSGLAHFIVWPDADKLTQPIITPTITL